MNKTAIIDLANHLENNVQDKEFGYSSAAECVLGHNARMNGITQDVEREYWDAAIRTFGSKEAASFVFTGVEFKYKSDTRNFIKRLLSPYKGPEIEIISFTQNPSRPVHYDCIKRMDAVRALRRLAETGEYKF